MSITTTPATPAALTPLALQYIAASKAPATLRAYRSAWAHYAAWCTHQGYKALPAADATLAEYIAQTAPTCKSATLQMRLVAIGQAHQAAGFASPTKTACAIAARKGAARLHAAAQRPRAALTVPQLRAMLAALPANAQGHRDAAILLVGFAGAFRRSELAALRLADIEIEPRGVTITIRRSKTDQAGYGRRVAIPRTGTATCPVAALEQWLQYPHSPEGPLFRACTGHGTPTSAPIAPQLVARVVKRACQSANISAETISAHSLRSGCATTAAANGAEERDIMRQTGHKSVAMVRRYIHEAELYTRNAASRLGL